jgi:hypothetical protein
VRYHCDHRPDLSPATSRTADRHGSKTSKIRTSLRPADGGRNSFMLAIRDAVTVSTSGRPVGRAVALQDQDGLVHQTVADGISVIQVVEESLDLRGHQDLPLHAHPPSTGIRVKNILNPDVSSTPSVPGLPRRSATGQPGWPPALASSPAADGSGLPVAGRVPRNTGSAGAFSVTLHRGTRSSDRHLTVGPDVRGKHPAARFGPEWGSGLFWFTCRRPFATSHYNLDGPADHSADSWSIGPVYLGHSGNGKNFYIELTGVVVPNATYKFIKSIYSIATKDNSMVRPGSGLSLAWQSYQLPEGPKVNTVVVRGSDTKFSN